MLYDLGLHMGVRNLRFHQALLLVMYHDLVYELLLRFKFYNTMLCYPYGT
jgi:hypothetical protein